MDISVIFATYKRPALLEETLRSYLALRRSQFSWEIIVVDNAGDPESENLTRKFLGILPLRYVICTKRGKNNALNRGISEANGELFVFSDDDVIVDPDWLTEIWEGANRWPGNHVFGGRILPRFPEGQSPPFDHPFFIGAYAIADWNVPEGIYKADRVWGPNMAIRSFLFREGWKFDPRIGPDGTGAYVAGSEVDLTRRLERAGYQAVYLPRSVVYHQIRSEQLHPAWLYRRAFRFGQQFSYHERRSAMPAYLGIPKHLVVRLFKTYARYLLALFFQDEKTRFGRRLDLWETRGRINFYRNIGAFRPGSQTNET